MSMTFEWDRPVRVGLCWAAVAVVSDLMIVSGVVFDGAPMLFGGLVATLAVLSMRWMNASRARALAARMREIDLERDTANSLP